MKKPFLLFAFTLISLFSFGQSADKLGVVKHNHLGLHVKNLEESAKFYRETLGLQPIPVPDDLKAIRAWFKIGEDQQIHLLAGRIEPVVNDRNGGHFALFVENMDQAEAFLKKRNIKYHAQVRFDGVKQIYFADPDGYLIEMQQITKTK